MQIIIEQEVTQKLQRLVITLVDEGYFATDESAFQYVQVIYRFIHSLPSRTHRTMTVKRKGAFCAMYKPNARTTWYVLFDIKDERYLVRNLLNNHEQDYPTFLKSLR